MLEEVEAEEEVEEVTEVTMVMVSYLYLTTHGGRELEPLEEATSGLNTGVVVVGTVGLVLTQISPGVTVRGSARTVTGTLDVAPDQRELVGVHDGVDGLQGDVGHLHGPRHPAALRLELVAESLAQTWGQHTVTTLPELIILCFQ